MELKQLIAELRPDGLRVPVMAKIEKPEALENIEAIIDAVDAIMVARGDLGIEIRPEEVPIAQKRIIRGLQPGRHSGGHGHADAGLDDPQPAPHARRGL